MVEDRTRDDPQAGRASRPSPLALLAIAVAYFLAGKLGLKLALVHASATAVWPPTGIALASFLLLGARVWPAIFLAAFLVNATTAGSMATSAGIALGNTLEGLLGAWLVTRFAGGRDALQRPGNVSRFALLAGFVSTAVSASLGVTSLALGGYARWGDGPAIWLTWWLGDVGGALVVAPAIILCVTTLRPRWNGARALEAGLLIMALGLVGLGVFGGLLPSGRAHYPVEFLSLPVLLWAAFRFGPREAALSNLVLSGVAVWGALHGFGPFGGKPPNESLLLLQSFSGVASLTMLTVAAAVAERRRIAEKLASTAAIVDSSDDAIIAKNLEGTIVAWNHGAERLYGYQAGEILGRKVSVLIPPGRPDETAEIVARVGRGERIEQYDTTRMRKDGRLVAVSLSVSPVRDVSGAIVGASATARDLTEQTTRLTVARLLSDSATLREVAPRVLEAVCDGLGWDAGELLLVEKGGMSAIARWPAASGRGEGKGPLGRESELPRRVRGSGEPLWLEDLETAPHLTREGLGDVRAVVGVPVRASAEVSGVLMVYSRAPRKRVPSVLGTLADIAGRLGQFMARVRVIEEMRRLKKAVESLDLGVTITDGRGRILYTNPAEADLHGYRVEELIGRHVSVFMPAAWEPAPGRPERLRRWRRETVNVHRDGTIFPTQLFSDVVLDLDGSPLGVVTVCEEITQRKRAEQALRASETRYRLLFERNLAGVYRATLDGRLLECNDAFARILGYPSREDALARSAWDVFLSREEREQCLVRLKQQGSLTNFELRMRRQDGSTAWVLENETLIDDEGQGIVEGTLIDITERKMAEERIEHQAYHDPLTGLPNRAFLTERLHLALAQSRRSGRGLALMFVDLDRLKGVNDSLGHALGDRLLQEAALRMKECLREDDTVARLGGDEFVVLLPGLRQPEGAERIAQKILSRMNAPFSLDGNEVSTSASIGVALFPRDGAQAETLLRKADLAMYRAKDRGRNTFQFCDPDGAGRHPEGLLRAGGGRTTG